MEQEKNSAAAIDKKRKDPVKPITPPVIDLSDDDDEVISSQPLDESSSSHLNKKKKEQEVNQEKDAADLLKYRTESVPDAFDFKSPKPQLDGIPQASKPVFYIPINTKLFFGASGEDVSFFQPIFPKSIVEYTLASSPSTSSGVNVSDFYPNCFEFVKVRLEGPNSRLLLSQTIAWFETFKPTIKTLEFFGDLGKYQVSLDEAYPILSKAFHGPIGNIEALGVEHLILQLRNYHPCQLSSSTKLKTLSIFSSALKNDKGQTTFCPKINDPSKFYKKPDDQLDQNVIYDHKDEQSPFAFLFPNLENIYLLVKATKYSGEMCSWVETMFKPSCFPKLKSIHLGSYSQFEPESFETTAKLLAKEKLKSCGIILASTTTSDSDSEEDAPSDDEPSDRQLFNSLVEEFEVDGIEAYLNDPIYSPGITIPKGKYENIIMECPTNLTFSGGLVQVQHFAFALGTMFDSKPTIQPLEKVTLIIDINTWELFKLPGSHFFESMIYPIKPLLDDWKKANPKLQIFIAFSRSLHPSSTWVSQNCRDILDSILTGLELDPTTVSQAVLPFC